MPEFFRFWGRCLSEALPRWEKGEALLSYAAPLAVKGLIWLLGFAAIPAFALQMWLIVAAVPLTLMLFVWAPFRVWQEENTRANKAEARLKPCLTVEGDVVNQDGKTAVVRVTNSGAETIRNCTGLLKKIFVEIDGRLEPLPKATVYLQWTARHGGIGKMAVDFAREAELDVAAFPVGYLGGFTLVAFDDRVRGQYGLPERSVYVFEIEIAAENSVAFCHRYRMRISPLRQWGKQDEYGQPIEQPPPDVTFERIGECVG